MNKSGCAVLAISAAMILGPPAAELSHEEEKAGIHVASLPRDTHEHSHEKHETTPVGEMNRADISATASVVSRSASLSVSWDRTILS